jgi:hypothetical protein
MDSAKNVLGRPRAGGHAERLGTTVGSVYGRLRSIMLGS